ncbi:hypothetical protein KQX54_004717 [Cotesia glomerata]|uniref:Uncharacterized protein n=1 Tax=Cotesia glomerata TaxID=32391 RepID=A0AAV7IFT0_COTGL|nr:hypothetical protein KQX54_004717 [Cotesia glomerata]
MSVCQGCENNGSRVTSMAFHSLQENGEGNVKCNTVLDLRSLSTQSPKLNMTSVCGYRDSCLLEILFSEKLDRLTVQL